NGDIVACIDRKQFQGYACLYDRGDCIVIDEIIYYDVKTLLKLINLALKIKPKVILHVSFAEPLERIFKQAPCKEYGYTMMRINNLDLFNRLYETNIHSTLEAIEGIKKPLFLKEER
ncbi:MAG: GNAT family N-acetyltransferase, partial [Erysipelotrichaceae bacterium]